MQKSTGSAYLFWLFFGAHYAYLGRWGTQIMLWLTLPIGIGFVWWFLDLFRIPGLVARYNASLSGGSTNLNANVNNVTVNIDSAMLDKLDQARRANQTIESAAATEATK